MAKKSIDYAAARRAAEEQAKKQKRHMKIFLISAIAVLLVAVAVVLIVNLTGESYVPLTQVQDEIDSYSVADFTETEKESKYVIIKVKNYGDIVCELREDIAPITVKNFKKLVSEKFYDGLIFHRVIEDFMIQGGGMDLDFKEKDAASIKGEFTSNGVANNLKHYRGVLSMARTNVKDSASSQFFIMHKTSPHLDGDYASFGYVLSGMEIVDKIATAKTNSSDAPLEPVIIESIRFATYNK